MVSFKVREMSQKVNICGGLTCQYLKFAIIVSFKVREMSLTDAIGKKETFNERVFQVDVKVDDSKNSRWPYMSVFEICHKCFI